MCVKKIVERFLYELVFNPDRHKIQQMLENSVDAHPLLLKYIPDWFVTP